jgi:hypothetical protein
MAAIISLSITLTGFTALSATTPTEGGIEDDLLAGMLPRLTVSQGPYYSGELITVWIDYENINAYPIVFKPPHTVLIYSGYGRPMQAPTAVTGWSVDPLYVGKTYTIPARGVYHLHFFEIPVEEAGSFYVSYLGVVKTLTIFDRPGE